MPTLGVDTAAQPRTRVETSRLDTAGMSACATSAGGTLDKGPLPTLGGNRCMWANKPLAFAPVYPNSLVCCTICYKKPI